MARGLARHQVENGGRRGTAYFSAKPIQHTRAKEFRNVDHEGLLLSREEMRVGFIS